MDRKGKRMKDPLGGEGVQQRYNVFIGCKDFLLFGIFWSVWVVSFRCAFSSLCAQGVPFLHTIGRTD